VTYLVSFDAVDVDHVDGLSLLNVSSLLMFFIDRVQLYKYL